MNELLQKQRYWNTNHRKLRTKLQPAIDAGRATCWRCNQLIAPGQPWDLGHRDNSNSYAGPEHRKCNRGAAAKKNTNKPTQAQRYFNP